MAAAKKITKFEELRRRAQSRNDEIPDEIVLFDESDGFDPPIVVKRMTMGEMEVASKLSSKDPFGSYRIVIGSENYDRIAEALGSAADLAALTEISSMVQDAFYGSGASAAPGGSGAS